MAAKDWDVGKLAVPMPFSLGVGAKHRGFGAGVLELENAAEFGTDFGDVGHPLPLI